MSSRGASEVEIDDQQPAEQELWSEVRAGLRATPKTLPSKLLYDVEGSHLFDRICELEDYYPTRTEVSILRANIDEIAAAVGPGCRLVELGSGSATKTEFLLEHLDRPMAYLPVEIARDHLMAAASELAARHPDLQVLPVCADYTRKVVLPDVRGASRTVVFFPGSTFGNFGRAESAGFLARLRKLAGDGGALLIGLDLVKDEGVLHRAYNDSEGVTAEFNLNLLTRLNREFDGDFERSAFRHRAVWDGGRDRIEMQLVSCRQQTVTLGGEQFAFGEEEAIRTEYSHKFTLDGFAKLARAAGFDVARVWTDPKRWFSLQYCVAT